MKTELDAARAELAAAAGALARADAALERIVHGASNTPFTTPRPTTATATEHRREHRMGRVPKIDADPELRAFVAACVDRCTFHEVADAVASASLRSAPGGSGTGPAADPPNADGRDGISAGLPASSRTKPPEKGVSNRVRDDNRLDPQAYLAHVLDRIYDHRGRRLDELLPRNSPSNRSEG